MRSRSLTSEIVERACAYVDRRGGAGIRRGGRGRGSAAKPKDRKLYGLTGFSASSRYETASGGGEAGVASGFGVAQLVQLTALPTGFEYLLIRCNDANAGFELATNGTGKPTFYAINGAGAFVQSAIHTFTASDIGKLFLLVAQHTGSALRLTVGREQIGADVVISGYTPHSGPTALGTNARWVKSFAPLAECTFRGTPSAAQLTALADYVRANGDLPSTMDGATVTHRWSAKDALRGVPNPAGRTITGARKFSATAYLATALGGGFQGTGPGGTFAVILRPEQIGAGTSTGVIVERRETAPAVHGAVLAYSSTASTIDWNVYDGSNALVTRSYSLTAQDVGRPLLVVGTYTLGGALRLYVNRNQVGADLAIASFAALGGTSRTLVGIREGGTLPFLNGSIFRVATAEVGLSPTEVAALYDTFDATGDLPAFTGATHRWALDDVPTVADTIGSHNLTRSAALEQARYVETAPPAPAALADTITAASADSLARVGTPTVKVIDPSVDGRKTYGVQGFDTPAAANYLESATNPIGATAGVPYWYAFYGTTYALTTGALRCLAGRRNTAVQSGWSLGIVNATNTPYIEQHNGTAIVSAIGASLTAGDISQPHVWTCVWTGSALRIYQDGVLQAETACAGLLPASGPFRVGRMNDSSFPAVSTGFFGDAGGTGTLPTASQIYEHAQATLKAGRIQKIEGFTSVLHDLTADIEANGGPSAGVPATVLDRVGTDHLTRVGTGLTVAQRVDRLYSWETSPILFGPTSFTLADYIEGLINALPGDALGFTVSVFGVPLTQAVVSSNRYLWGQRGAGNQGWNFAVTGTNSAVVFGAGGNTTAVNSPSSTIAAGDVGKLGLWTGVYDGSARIYAKRAQSGSGSALTGGYAPDTSVKPTVGKRSSGAGIAADGWAIYGVCYALGAATLAQVQAQHDAVMATERIQLPPGMPGTLVDFTADVLANGNALPASFADRGVGGGALSRVGALGLSSQYARAFSW